MEIGDLVTDGDGAVGRVTKIEYVPARGMGYHAKEDIYVKWLIPDFPDVDLYSSQEKHG